MLQSLLRSTKEKQPREINALYLRLQRTVITQMTPSTWAYLRLQSFLANGEMTSHKLLSFLSPMITSLNLSLWGPKRAHQMKFSSLCICRRLTLYSGLRWLSHKTKSVETGPSIKQQCSNHTSLKWTYQYPKSTSSLPTWLYIMNSGPNSIWSWAELRLND